LKDATLVQKDGNRVPALDVLSKKVVALYFSAHWCPPCRGFTPKLAEWYNAHLKAKGLEVIFVSSDRDEEAFKEYYNDMPWLALEYSNRKGKEQLSNLFKVQGIPSVVILDKDLSVINKDGRSAISGDPEGAEFPWHPKPVSDLKSGPGNINEVPTLIAFCELADAATKSSIFAAMKGIAEEYLNKAKSAGEDDPEVAFTMATEKDGLPAQIRGMLGMKSLEGVSEGVIPRLMLVDIPDEGGYYEGPEGPITAESVKTYVNEYMAKKLDRKQLS